MTALAVAVSLALAAVACCALVVRMLRDVAGRAIEGQLAEAEARRDRTLAARVEALEERVRVAESLARDASLGRAVGGRR